MKQVIFFSPSGALINEALLDCAALQLQALGFTTAEMPETRLREQRFAGQEASRIASINRLFQSSPPALLMATRGGYGLSRLLPELDFSALAQQLNQNGHVLIGHSDITSLQLALLGAGAKPSSLLHGPLACFDFGSQDGVNLTTRAHFLNAVQDRRVQVHWSAHGIICSQKQHMAHPLCGPVWGGNLTLLCSLLGTPWFPSIQGGILVLEDVNEPVFKIERMLLQLLHAGVLPQQKAIVLGNFCEPMPCAHDHGYELKSAAEFVQNQLGQVPVFMNFPFGHCTPKACWFQGGLGQLSIDSSGQASLIQMMGSNQ